MLEKAKTLRKANMVSAAYTQTEKMDNALGFFERYVSEWNPNKDGRGKDLVGRRAHEIWAGVRRVGRRARAAITA